MKFTSVYLGLVSGILSAGVFLPGMAQVTSDGTTNTTVNTNGNNFTILNGIEKGNNLFHSFSNFSVPTGGSAKFDLVNTPNITTIFSRITGGNISNIDGLIQTLNGNNPASLFLMNPNGIVFGENAKLDISGSFVGTTANSIKFSDGVEFSAVNPTEAPLLTMSVPVGLQMGQNPEVIEVNGNGHPLNIPLVGFPVQGTVENTGISVTSGKTLALIGGEITLNGGILAAAEGHLELGSVENAEVSLKPSSQGWQFSYDAVQKFQDIRLSQQALVDASGLGGGSIRLQGNNIDFQDGSLLLLRNLGFLPSGDISINAASNLNINGTTSDGSLPSGVIGQVLGAGGEGKIFVQANQAFLNNGGSIRNETYSQGKGGNVIVDIADTLTLSGSAPLNPLFASSITSTAFGDGDAGNLIASTRNLVLKNSGIISTTTFGKGDGGNLNINATDSIDIIIDTSLFSLPSAITAETISSGDAGNLRIDTSKLSINGGGRILTSTRGNGKAGDILINASDSIEVRGYNQGALEVVPSLISSNAEPLPVPLQILFGAPALPSGDSGRIEINTPTLFVDNNAAVTVGNLGTGNAGNLNIQAQSIYLDNQGQITAATESGKGGNLSLQIKDLLLLRNNSLINTEAKGTGNGGNMTINSPIIAGLENSDIIANAVEGNGGNINISTQGIFGLEFRDQLTDESDITASSQFGVSGTVKINNVGIDPSSGLVELPVNTTDNSQQIARGCTDTSGSSFIATGRGGIPTNPNQDIKSDRTWSDIRDISAYRQDKPVTATIPAPSQPIIQATGWRRNADGKVELVADKSSTQAQQSLTCAAVPHN